MLELFNRFAHSAGPGFGASGGFQKGAWSLGGFPPSLISKLWRQPKQPVKETATGFFPGFFHLQLLCQPALPARGTERTWDDGIGPYRTVRSQMQESAAGPRAPPRKFQPWMISRDIF